MRFYLAHTRPEVGQTNFSRIEFEQTLKQALLYQWNPWLQGVHSRLMDKYDGILPEPGAWTDRHRVFYQELNRCVEDISSAYNAETFSPQKVTRVLCELVRMASSFGQSEAALSKFETKKEERRTAIALEFAAVKALALLAAPLMPEFAADLWQYLGYARPIWDSTWEDTLHFVPSNRLIQTPPPQLAGSVAS